MRLSPTPTLIGFSVALSASCAGWSPLPDAGVPLRTGEASVNWTGTGDPADPEPAAAATTAEASAVTAKEPAPKAAAPRLFEDAAILDATVTDLESASYGRVQDLLLDPSTGTIAGVLVARNVSAKTSTKAVLHFRSLRWSSDDANALAISFRNSPKESLLSSADYADLLESYGLTQVSGDIVEKARVATSASKSLILKVRDEGNLLHRVLIEPANLVTSYADGWKRGRMIQVKGVMTRDSVGKLLVASSVTQNGEVLSLRNSKGEILWDDLVQPFRSARGLNGLSIQTVDGTSHPITGWIINVQLARVSYLVLDVDGTPRALPWTAVERTGETWKVSYGRQGLPDLPELVRRDGRLELP